MAPFKIGFHFCFLGNWAIHLEPRNEKVVIASVLNDTSNFYR
jgi:hypothetical protein